MYRDNNVRALMNAKSILAEKCIDIRNELNDQFIKHAMTKDNRKVIMINKDGKWQHLGSIYYFEKEADRWLEKYGDVRDFATIVVFGLSGGDFIKKLLELLPQHINVIVYEPSAMIFNYVLDNYDISSLIEDERMHLFVKGINGDTLDACMEDNINETNYKISLLDTLPRYRDLFPEDFELLNDCYNLALVNCVSDRLSVEDHGRLEVENSIYNLKLLDNCYLVSEFAGKLPTELPVVIVSAGPSLEKNGHILKQIKNHLFIIAVDTALTYLLSIGVFPDVAISVSPNKDKTFETLYKNPELKNIPFVIDAIVTHTGIECVADNGVIFASASSPYYKKLFSIAGHDIDSLENGGSVSTVAFTVAREWGFDKFVFVGLDLALKDDKLYAGDMWKGTTDGMDIVEIDGYYGRSVLTRPAYKLHLDWFEKMLRAYPQLTIYNATEGGALIHGAENKALSDIADEYRYFDCNYEKIFKNGNRAFAESQVAQLHEIIDESPAKIGLLKDILERGIFLAEETVTLLDGGVAYTDRRITDRYTEISSIIEQCSSIEESFFAERIANEKNGDILEDINIGDEDPAKEFRRILRKINVYFSDMLEASEEVIRLFDKMLGRSDISLETCISKTGVNITKISKAGKSQYMNSSYDPIKEASRVAAQYKDINDHGVLLIFGLSNGIIPRAIVDAVPNNTTIIFYEPSKEIYEYTVNNFDITDIDNNPRVHIFVNGMNDEKLELVIGSMVNEANYRYTYFDALPRYRAMFPEQCDIIQSRFENIVQTERNNIETIKCYGKSETENNIYNLRLLKNCNCEEEYRDMFPTELPVVIVSAGPSIKKNVNVLKKLKGKLLIMAVDTVVNYLMENDVRPDIVVSVDADLPERAINRWEKERLIFACGTGVNHNTSSFMGDGRKIIITSRASYYDKLMSIAGHHMYALNNGGSVTTVAFALAQSWGYRRFVLVGQDLAIEGNNRYADQSLNHDGHRKNLSLVEGYNGGFVETPADLKIYLEWFEMVSRSHPEFEIINSTEGGAKIIGTIQRPLVEVAHEYSGVDYNYEDIIISRKPLFTDEKYDRLVECINGSVDNLDSIKNMLDRGILLIEQAENILSNTGLVPEITEISRKISEIMDYCAGAEESYFIDGIISEKHADDLVDIYEDSGNPLTEYRRMLEKTKEYARDMYLAVDEVKGMFEEVLKDM